MATMNVSLVELVPGRFTHHVELYGISDVDEFSRTVGDRLGVRACLRR